MTKSNELMAQELHGDSFRRQAVSRRRAMHEGGAIAVSLYDANNAGSTFELIGLLLKSAIERIAILDRWDVAGAMP